MRVERFWSYQLGIVNHWLRKRDEPEIQIGEVPHFGVIAYSDNVPVAAGFIRKCEGALGIFDSLVTDPEASSKDRHEAIEQITSCILETARGLEMTRVIAFTRHSGIVERAKARGFEKQPFEVISLRF